MGQFLSDCCFLLWNVMALISIKIYHSGIYSCSFSQSPRSSWYQHFKRIFAGCTLSILFLAGINVATEYTLVHHFVNLCLQVMLLCLGKGPFSLLLWTVCHLYVTRIYSFVIYMSLVHLSVVLPWTSFRGWSSCSIKLYSVTLHFKDRVSVCRNCFNGPVYCLLYFHHFVFQLTTKQIENESVLRQ